MLCEFDDPVGVYMLFAYNINTLFVATAADAVATVATDAIVPTTHTHTQIHLMDFVRH